MLLGLLAFALAQDCPGDCDGDGWTVVDGDCNDGDPEIYPSQVESCENDLDDNCDRFVNEGCERATQLGQFGGGGCSGAAPTVAEQAPTAAGLFLFPLCFGMRRRR